MKKSKMKKPDAVQKLEDFYGPPSQEAFASATFYKPLQPNEDLTEKALEIYKYFVGELWERWGEEAWMGPWKEVYSRPSGSKRDLAAEMNAIEDREAALSIPLLLDGVETPGEKRDAFQAVFDDAAVEELRIFNLGDGGAMSGLLVAARNTDLEAGIFLTFLLD